MSQLESFVDRVFVKRSLVFDDHRITVFIDFSVSIRPPWFPGLRSREHDAMGEVGVLGDDG
jgi:hypothetical protein